MLFEVTMLEDRIAHLFMFVCLFMFCFPFTLSSLGRVYCAGFCTSLKYMLQDDGCMDVWVTTDQRTYRRAEAWAHQQLQIGHSHSDCEQ